MCKSASFHALTAEQTPNTVLRQLLPWSFAASCRHVKQRAKTRMPGGFCCRALSCLDGAPFRGARMSRRPIAVYHEHPDWFRPLFAELERRGIPFERLDAAAHSFDPTETRSPYSLV